MAKKVGLYLPDSWEKNPKYFCGSFIRFLFCNSRQITVPGTGFTPSRIRIFGHITRTVKTVSLKNSPELLPERKNFTGMFGKGRQLESFIESISRSKCPMSARDDDL